jgi:hypothetical protein
MRSVAYLGSNQVRWIERRSNAICGFFNSFGGPRVCIPKVSIRLHPYREKPGGHSNEDTNFKQRAVSGVGWCPVARRRT